MTPELQAITQRLAEVEKQVAHLAALVTEQSDADRTVVARSFVVKDAEGKQRGTLEVNEGCSGLWLYDANGNMRAGLTVVNEGGPSLALRDTEGRAVVDIWGKEKGSSIDFWHANGEQRLSMTVTEDGAWVGLGNSNTKRKLSLHVSPTGEARLFMGDLDGPSLKLAVESEGPCLLLGKDNKTIWSAP